MRRQAMLSGVPWLVAAALTAGGWSNCWAAETKTEEPPAKAEDPDDDTPVRKIRDLGSPLVDDVKALKRLDPVLPMWIDPKQKQVVILCEACKANYPLEFLITDRGRDYESVMVTDAKPSVVHAGLLALGAKPGHPARFQPKYEPATGTVIQIEVRWKDKNGKRQTAKAQDWIRNIKTKQALDVEWVFAGSGFWLDETTGKKVYQADGGDFISVLNLPTAMLDLPIQSAGALEERSFEGFLDWLPPSGTPVTVILKPKVEKAKEKAKENAEK
jgi:hypothetical protein